jgi:hypothetical protein
VLLLLRLLLLLLLLQRRGRLGAEPDAARVLLLASFRDLWRFQLRRRRRVLRLRGWLDLGAGLLRLGLGLGRVVVLLMLGFFLRRRLRLLRRLR